MWSTSSLGVCVSYTYECHTHTQHTHPTHPHTRSTLTHAAPSHKQHLHCRLAHTDGNTITKTLTPPTPTPPITHHSLPHQRRHTHNTNSPHPTPTPHTSESSIRRQHTKNMCISALYILCMATQDRCILCMATACLDTRLVLRYPRQHTQQAETRHRGGWYRWSVDHVYHDHVYQHTKNCASPPPHSHRTHTSVLRWV